MVSIKWCFNQEKGFELISPNQNMSQSYMGMAQESVEILEKVNESHMWTATITYYIFYYSLSMLL